ncbi:Hypothetical predicted protein [Paramuricea clavata]|uniref:Uncharacterized protein n=1 Tax=Paramuricea clavata TaxID=317549 RepID=A0A6S7K2K7_PARCT|nr:Hypothetical predicted protein [Paramuricea clavata]
MKVEANNGGYYVGVIHPYLAFNVVVFGCGPEERSCPINRKGCDDGTPTSVRSNAMLTVYKVTADCEVPQTFMDIYGTIANVWGVCRTIGGPENTESMTKAVENVLAQFKERFGWGYVRVEIKHKTFEKGYEPNFDNELYVVQQYFVDILTCIAIDEDDFLSGLDDDQRLDDAKTSSFREENRDDKYTKRKRQLYELSTYGKFDDIKIEYVRRLFQTEYRIDPTDGRNS